MSSSITHKLSYLNRPLMSKAELMHHLMEDLDLYLMLSVFLILIHIKSQLLIGHFNASIEIRHIVIELSLNLAVRWLPFSTLRKVDPIILFYFHIFLRSFTQILVLTLFVAFTPILKINLRKSLRLWKFNSFLPDFTRLLHTD